MNGLRISIKKATCLAALPVVFYLCSTAIFQVLPQKKIFLESQYLPEIFYAFYIIYLTLLPNYNCMSIIRFKSSTKLMDYFLKKTISSTVFYLIYTALIYFVFCMTMQLSFTILDIFKFILFNLIAMLIMNLYGIVFGLKFGKGYAKLSVIILFILLITIYKLDNIIQNVFFKSFSLFWYPSITEFPPLQVITIVSIYGFYILLALFIYYFIKRDLLGAYHE